MTLLIHPTSTCDVCLEPYSWSTQAQTPHAIACGHVFCLNCLQNLRQPVCPLCRKSFQPDRAKRLHVDKFTGESDADTIDQDVFALMQRIALVSGEHQPEEQVTETIRDVEGWLNTQPGGSSPTSVSTISLHAFLLQRGRATHVGVAIHRVAIAGCLRGQIRTLSASIDALRRYRLHKESSARESEKLREALQQCESALHQAEEDTRIAKILETRFLEQQQEHLKQIEDAQTELTSLRTELSRFRSTSNPLPAPPAPVPIPQFTRAPASEHNGHSHRQPVPLDRTSSWPHTSSRTEQADRAYPNPGYAPRPHSRSRVDAPHILQDTDRDGPGYTVRPPSRSNATIIPGAPPAKRVVPPVPTWQSDTNRYGGGLTIDVRDDWAYIREPTPADFGMDETAVAESEAFVAGYASSVGEDMYATPYEMWGTSAPAEWDEESEPESDAESEGSIEATPRAPQERGVGSLGLIGVPEADARTPRARDTELARPTPQRAATTEGLMRLSRLHDGTGGGASSTLDAFSLDANNPYGTDRRTPRLRNSWDSADDDEIQRPDSATSWGTSTVRSSYPNSHFSMSDLNLQGLPPYATFTATSRDSVTSLTELPFPANASMPARNSSTPTDQGSASRGHFFASDTRSHTRVRGSGYSNEEDEHRTPMSTFPTSHSSSMTVPRARSHHSAEVGASARSDPPQSDQGQGTLSTRQRRQSAGGSSIASSEDGYASSHASRDRSSRTDRHVRWHEPPPVISEPSGTGHHRGNRVHSYDQAGSAPDSQRSRSSRPRNPSSASLPEPPRPPAEVPERISSVAANHSDDDPGYTVFPHMSTHHPRRRSSSNASTHSTTLRQPVSFSSSSQPSEWVYSHQVGTWVSAITGQTADGRAVSTRSNLAASSTTANAQSGRTSNAHSAPMLPRSWSTRS